MEIVLKKAFRSDCEELHNLQVKSFEDLLLKYRDYDTNPAAEPIDKIIERMEQETTDYYFIQLNGKNIGGIRIVRKEGGTCRISQMFILPQFQGNGYAQKAIMKVEQLYPAAKHWELDTIKQERKLCHLYEKMGYKRTGRETDIQDGMTLVDYAK